MADEILADPVVLVDPAVTIDPGIKPDDTKNVVLSKPLLIEDITPPDVAKFRIAECVVRVYPIDADGNESHAIELFFNDDLGSLPTLKGERVIATASTDNSAIGAAIMQAIRDNLSGVL